MMNASALIERLVRNNITDPHRCVLLVGSGLSSAGVLPDGRGLPTWPNLASLMIEDLVYLGHIDQREESRLRESLKEGCASSYLAVASAYKARTDDPEFESFLVRHLDPEDIRPSELHRDILEIGFRAVITTNFDRVFELAGPRIPAYAYPDFLGRRDVLQSTTTILLKLHGSIVPRLNLKSRLVISQEDYESLHANVAYQEALRSMIAGNPVLVAGYSCQDPDFLQVMADLTSPDSIGPFVHVLLRRPSPTAIGDMRSRNVKVIPYDDHGEIPLLFEDIASEIRQKGEDSSETGGERATSIAPAARAGLRRRREGSIPTGSIGLNIALGTGGWPRKHIGELVGPAGSGKSSLVMHAIAEAQRTGGAAALIDGDRATDPILAERFGIDIDRLYYCRPNTLEEALHAMIQLLGDNLVDLVALDSIASLLPHSALESSDLRRPERDTEGRSIVTTACQKVLSGFASSKAAVLVVNQLMMEVGVMFGNPETMPWHTTVIHYYASLRVDLRRRSTMKEGERAVGQRVRAQVLKNRFAEPFRTAEFDIMFDSGISYELELLELACKEGIVAKNGAWFKYRGKGIG